MIVIEVRDGFVWNVWSDTSREYIIVDWDAEEHSVKFDEQWVHTIPMGDIANMSQEAWDVIKNKMSKG